MAKSKAEKARDNLLEAVSKERAKSNPNKRVLKRLQGQLTRMGGGSKATRTPAKNPDVVSVRNLPKPKGMLVGEPKSRGMLVGEPKPRGMLVGEPKPRGMLVGEPKRSGMLVGEPKRSGMLVGEPSRSTSNAKPKAKPTSPRRPTVGGNMIGGTPPGGGTLSKKDVDEYGEAFASPDADKMYNLSEKNRRKDMNMLERAFDSIKVAGDRATADRKKRGLSNYDMNEDVFGSRSGGGIKKTMNNKQPSTRKRAAQRGFGVETRGN